MSDNSPGPGGPPSRRGALAASWGALSLNIRGAGCVAFGALLLVLMALLAKQLSETLPVFVIVFVRFLAGFFVLLPAVWRAGFGQLRTKRLGLLFSRGVVGFLGNLSLFFAIAHIALADAITIQFSRPLIMVIVGAIFLGEVIGWRRAGATAAGFVGLLMITRPFTSGFDPWTLVAVAGAIIATGVIVIVKILSRTEPTIVIMFYFSAVTTALALIPAIIVWQTPTMVELGLLVLTGALGVIGQYFFTHGIGLGETSFVLPFDYLRIVYAFGFGIILFGEIPAPWSFAGAAVIAISSAYLLRTEQRRR
jgi:drug/metabolite transporter (DMT)-like permease